MVKVDFKQIDLLEEKKTSYLAEPYFIDTKKYKRGLFFGLILIVTSLFLELHLFLE